jgi:hypothetical protein
MYNKRYLLEKIEEFNGHNPIYENVEGAVCYPAYFNVGERGWFLYIENIPWGEYAHRINTSIIKDVVYTRGNQIIVTTQNTKFTFTAII